MEPIVYTTRIFLGWVFIITGGLTLLIIHSNGKSDFFRIGPHDNLNIMGITIDTGWKYSLLVIYTFINSMFRTSASNILSPWMINNIQDINKDKRDIKHAFAYEITNVYNLYHWIDWLLYMNILLAQMDLVCIEVFADTLMSNTTTYLYLNDWSKKGYSAVRDIEIAE